MQISTRGRRALAVLLCGYSAALAIALLAPTSGTQSGMASWLSDLGVAVGFSPETASQARAEFVANALILMPLSALGSLLWPRTTWRDWTAYAFVLAMLVEVTQGVLLPDRNAATADVVANTLGGFGGAAVVAVVRWLQGSRQARPPMTPLDHR